MSTITTCGLEGSFGCQKPRSMACMAFHEYRQSGSRTAYPSRWPFAGYPDPGCRGSIGLEVGLEISNFSPDWYSSCMRSMVRIAAGGL